MFREQLLVEMLWLMQSEWTYEGGRKRERVVTDGDRTRYQNGLHFCAKREVKFYLATWVVPQDFTSCPNRGRAFFIDLEEILCF